MKIDLERELDLHADSKQRKIYMILIVNVDLNKDVLLFHYYLNVVNVSTDVDDFATAFKTGNERWSWCILKQSITNKDIIKIESTKQENLKKKSEVQLQVIPETIF